MNQVSAILEDVRTRGDEALIEYTARFDRCRITVPDLKISVETLRELASTVSHSFREALREAILRVRRFHEQQCESSWQIDGPNSVALGQRITPLESTGAYIPGGSASYPSSAIMNVV